MTEGSPEPHEHERRSSSPGLPDPKGVLGHLRYSVAALGELRALRAQLDGKDESLASAARARDVSLADLGRAALESVSPSSEGRVGEYQATLDDIDLRQEEIARRGEECLHEQAAVESEGRASDAGFQRRIDELDDELVPLQSERRRLADERENMNRESRRSEVRLRNLADRIEHNRRALEPSLAESAETEVDPRKIEDENRSLTDELLRLEDDGRRRSDQLEALADPLDAVEAQIREKHAALLELKEARRQARLEAKRRLDALADEAAALGKRATDMQARRRAALVDLGREALRMQNPPDSITGKRREAADAIERMRVLTSEREALIAQRAEIDEGPVIRTGLVALGFLLVLLIVAVVR